jgi:hypothetical protein
LCQNDDGNTDETVAIEKLPPSAIKIARVTQTISVTSAQDIARALLLQEGDSNMARARVQAMYKLLLETERYLANE